MGLESATKGEDVPLRISFTDSSGNAIAPDGVSGGSGPTITVTARSTGTEVVSAVVMTENSTGVYEHVWDTAANLDVTGTYEVQVSGEFSSETKISQTTIEVNE